MLGRYLSSTTNPVYENRDNANVDCNWIKEDEFKKVPFISNLLLAKVTRPSWKFLLTKSSRAEVSLTS